MDSIIKIPFFAINEKTGRYMPRRSLTEKQILKAANTIIKKRIKKGFRFSNPADVSAFCQAKLHGLETEVFLCLFLNNQHELITAEELFRGTIDGAAVYPREVVKKAISHNAAAVIFAHNHPSGSTKPSSADLNITERLKEALKLIDIRTLDHIIVGDGEPLSFTNNGFI